MLGEGGTPLSRLQAAVREFQAREERRVDPKGLRGVIDALEGEFATEVREAQKSGDHLISGNMGPATWIGLSCGMSVNSAADRLCVGEQLESLPKIAAALSSSTKRTCSTGRGGCRSKSCRSFAASPGMSATPTASSTRPRPTSPGAG